MPPRRQSQRQNAASARQGLSTHSSRGPIFISVTAEDKEKIVELMKQHFGWSHEPRPMQVKAALAQVDGEDVIVHAPTGHGKTGIVAGPHAFPQNKGRVTIFVSPLIALQEEMVTTFKADYNLNAVAVNSTRTKSLTATMQDICAGKYAVVLISPEMLQSKRFIDNVLRDAEFFVRFLSLVVDEAHTVSHWGAHFRKKYGTLGVVRAFLRAGTSVVAMSASLTPRVRRDILKKLQFSSNFINIDEGNNRPNVAIVVRACHRQLSSFADLDFVIPANIQAAQDIPSTFIYCDKKEEGDAIVDHLRERLPESVRELGLVRPFNASLSHHYRRNALQHFRAGNIRVMVCTDAAGMGCNIPNIEIVVQWRLPEKLSMFVQRAGRAARRPGTSGLAVLLVEPTAYTEFIDKSFAHDEDSPAAPPAPPTHGAAAPKKKTAKKKSKAGRAPRGYAKAHGRNRGCSCDEETNARHADLCLKVDEAAEDEGLLCLVQTGDCRRRVIADAFGNTDRSALGPCCDLCNPTLFARTLPGRGPKQKPRLTKKDKNNTASDVIDALYDWRLSVWKEDLAYTGFSDVALLSDERILTLARVPEFNSERVLKVEMGEWRWWTRYGRSLWRALAGVYNERAAQDPAPTTSTKRKRGAPSSSTQPALHPSNTHTPSAAASSSASAAQSTSSMSGAPAKRPRTTAPPPAAVAAAPPHLTHPPPGIMHMPEHVPLTPGATVPRILRDLAPVPTPSGPTNDPSRVVHGSDGRYYFAAVDRLWYRMPQSFTPQPARGGRGAGRARGRGRGGRGAGPP